MSSSIITVCTRIRIIVYTERQTDTYTYRQASLMDLPETHCIEEEAKTKAGSATEGVNVSSERRR